MKLTLVFTSDEGGYDLFDYECNQHSEAIQQHVKDYGNMCGLIDMGDHDTMEARYIDQSETDSTQRDTISFAENAKIMDELWPRREQNHFEL